MILGWQVLNLLFFHIAPGVSSFSKQVFAILRINTSTLPQLRESSILKSTKSVGMLYWFDAYEGNPALQYSPFLMCETRLVHWITLYKSPRNCKISCNYKQMQLFISYLFLNKRKIKKAKNFQILLRKKEAYSSYWRLLSYTWKLAISCIANTY